MLETAELGRKISKQDFKEQLPELRMNLLSIQDDLKTADFPVIIVVAGADGAGKGDTVNRLSEWMDPRYLETHAFGPPTDEELQRPTFWRYWRRLPPKGRIGVFLGSWYTKPILDRVYGLTTQDDLDTRLSHINAFEKELVDDGALVIKLWFHISKQKQKKRLRKLEANPDTAWRVSKQDWKHYKLSDTFREVDERALRATSTGEAPWLVIEGVDSRYRTMTAARYVHDLIRRRLDAGKITNHSGGVLPISSTTTAAQVTILDQLDLTKHLESGEYRERLAHIQGKVSRLAREASQRGISSLLVFEGWDAAGKGGAIRRVSAALDARHYQIIPIAAPSDEEQARHYLWRFWRHIPRAGKLTMYDRSWYGRVLVERIEGFATEPEWVRAYAEINSFEEQLHHHGMVLVKYWLHIDKDEQLRRFKEREATGFKRYKITEDDYRNRDKWDDYRLAVNDMVQRTSTEYAPWTLVEANSKRYARVKVLETFYERLSQAL